MRDEVAAAAVAAAAAVDAATMTARVEVTARKVAAPTAKARARWSATAAGNEDISSQSVQKRERSVADAARSDT